MKDDCVTLGTLPLKECYFISGDETGLHSSNGQILALHLPTKDIWSLTANGPYGLILDRIIEKGEAPPALESPVQTLLENLHRQYGKLKAPLSQSGIAQSFGPTLKDTWTGESAHSCYSTSRHLRDERTGKSDSGEDLDLDASVP